MFPQSYFTAPVSTIELRGPFGNFGVKGQSLGCADSAGSGFEG